MSGNFSGRKDGAAAQKNCSSSLEKRHQNSCFQNLLALKKALEVVSKRTAGQNIQFDIMESKEIVSLLLPCESGGVSKTGALEIETLR